MRYPAAVVLAFLTAAPALARAEVPVPVSGQAKPTDSAKAEKRMNCHYETPTGSRLSIRVCRDAQAEAADAQNAQDALQNAKSRQLAQ